MANLAIATTYDAMAAVAAFRFDNSFARELEGFYVPQQPAVVRAPRLLFLNDSLAAELGLDLNSLDAGARADTANQDGETPLMLAIKTGELPVVEMLINAGAKVNVKETFHNQTALMYAAAAERNCVFDSSTRTPALSRIVHIHHVKRPRTWTRWSVIVELLLRAVSI